MMLYAEGLNTIGSSFFRTARSSCLASAQQRHSSDDSDNSGLSSDDTGNRTDDLFLLKHERAGYDGHAGRIGDSAVS